MKEQKLIIVGIIVILLVTGCRSNSGNGENVALKEQIAQLEQQVTALEEQITALRQQITVIENENNSPQEQPVATDNDAQGQPANDGNQESSVLSTTRTMEELTAMVEAFVEKAETAAPGESSSENMEQFFSLKQEEKQIDDALDLHENELENLYRQNTLTRDEYRSMERELEKLEDMLDNAEDRLERTFGIND